jgi:hypothetical protein
MAAKKQAKSITVAGQTFEIVPPQNEESSLVIPSGIDDLAGDDPDSDYSALDKLMVELDGADDGGGKVFVYKVNGGNAKPAYCFDCLPGEFSFAKISREFGGGKYRIKIYALQIDDKGRRKYTIQYNRECEVQPYIAAPASPDKPAGALTREDLVEAIRAAIPQAPPPPDPITAMQPAMSLMKTMFEMMPKPGGGGSPMGMVKDVIEVMGLVRGAAGDFAPSGGPGRSDTEVLADTANKLIPVILEGMKQNRENPPQAAAPAYPAIPRVSVMARPDPANPARQNPGGARVSLNPQPMTVRGAQAAPAPASTDMETQKMMSTLLSLMAAKAAKNADPYRCAQFLLEQIDDDQIDDFADLLEMPGWWEMLCTANPGIAPYQVWFGRLRDVCLAELGPAPGAPAVDPQGQAPAAPAKPVAPASVPLEESEAGGMGEGEHF